VGLKSLKSLNLTNGYPNKNKNKNNNKVQSKPLELRSRIKICQIFASMTENGQNLRHQKSYLVVEIAITTIGKFFAKFKQILFLIGLGYYG
jgi:hypothetical protein